jgi:hypothetical protein
MSFVVLFVLLHSALPILLLSTNNILLTPKTLTPICGLVCLLDTLISVNVKVQFINVYFDDESGLLGRLILLETWFEHTYTYLISW